MKKSKILLITLLIFSGAILACGSNHNLGGGQAENKKTEPTKNETENKNTAQPAPTPKEEIVNIIDGREERLEKEGTEAEKQLVNKEFKLKEAEILKKSQFQCDEGTEEGIEIIGTAEGSFTKPNSSQKVFLYERCRAGRAFGIGGILVVEDGKAVSHYTYGENGLDSGIFSLPDVNKNGLSEMVIIAAGSGQGYMNVAIYLFELKDGNMKFMGNTPIYDDNSGAMENESKIETNAYKISVQTADNPVFLREHYQKKGNAAKWSLIKKSAKFSLEKGDAGKYLKIS